MKIEDPRVTDYALGELQGSAREAFEKELVDSSELQRELDDTVSLCQKLSGLALANDGFDEAAREKLRAECLRNVQVVRRERVFRRAAIVTVLGAAACLLLAPLILRTPVIQRPPKNEGLFDSLVVAQSEPKSKTAQNRGSLSEMIASAEAPPRLARLREYDPSMPAPAAPAASGYESAINGPRATPLARSGGTGFRRSTPKEMVSEVLPFDTEAYDAVEENRFRAAKENPLSTFSIDVDTASYSNIRRFLMRDRLPPPGAVRIEELINYFSYDYPEPKAGDPFSINTEVSRAPWNERHQLVRIGLKGRGIAAAQRPASNLVFLVDVSGSMEDPDKLPLLKRSLRALVENLTPKDRVAIVVYAGSSGLALPSTSGADKDRVLKALDELEAGGSTNGAEGILLAYRTARENFIKEGNNRVILCTDGDFNVGVTNQSELVSLIERERASGIFLSVLGFGTGNLKDSTMEKLADRGNGNYAYIDSLSEGRKVLVEQAGATLFAIAKDVKIQVEFNPRRVAGYRLIGYENRLLAKEDFNDDRKDAGEIGAGHSVSAFYEVVPAGESLPDATSTDALKYQAPAIDQTANSDELLNVKLRYKAPDDDKSRLLDVPVAAATEVGFDKASRDFQFAAAVAAFGMKLRNSPHIEGISWQEIQKIARRNLGEDPGTYRAEFLTVVEKARALDETHSGAPEVE
jgi:Ca-activated chloride channel family protein